VKEHRVISLHLLAVGAERAVGFFFGFACTQLRSRFVSISVRKTDKKDNRRTIALNNCLLDRSWILCIRISTSASRPRASVPFASWRWNWCPDTRALTDTPYATVASLIITTASRARHRWMWRSCRHRRTYPSRRVMTIIILARHRWMIFWTTKGKFGNHSCLLKISVSNPARILI